VKFCGECGARLEAMCPICAAGNPPANKFCHQCGGTLVTAPAQSPSTSPESYIPKHLAEKILASRATLEGERKQVTVLFADLKGSMELLADRDPEEARKLLDPVIEHMMEAVHRYEGTVNQVMGDGIMALFGAPLAHEDHAVRACYAALRMQESLKRYADDTRRAHGVEVQIRVGLNSGEVVAGSVGSDLRMDYTAVGQTTHLAARMEQMALPGTVRLTASRSAPRRRTITKPRPWPRSWACARSSPTATSASASSTGAQARQSRRQNTSPPPTRCTARWTCASGWNRRRRRWERDRKGYRRPRTRQEVQPLP
jgi:class 3 adenylate cyclase